MRRRPLEIPPSRRPSAMTDHKASSHGHRRSQKPNNKLVIPVGAKPADYVPGSGPPLQPVTLLPPEDGTAYILERIFLLPSELAKDGRPLPKQMMYLVGWRDLAAASVLVPAMQILDYVSPRVLEDWEFKEEEVNRMLSKASERLVKADDGEVSDGPQVTDGEPLEMADEVPVFADDQDGEPALEPGSAPGSEAEPESELLAVQTEETNGSKESMWNMTSRMFSAAFR